MLPRAEHPNRLRWETYHLNGLWRGELAAQLLHALLPTRPRVLDVGCGTGGTTVALASRGATVVALEVDQARLHATQALARAKCVTVRPLCTDAVALPFASQSFDAVLLQDVLEHVSAPQLLLRESSRVLRRRGVLFLTTPNRWSPFNAVADPHWGLPVVALLSRTWVARLTKARRIGGPTRAAVPTLVSLRLLRNWMRETGLEVSFANRSAARYICSEPHAALCSRLHLRLTAWARRAGVLPWLPRLVNDRWGLFNWWLNPTWYIVARKP
ncbi:MAG: methyltransferase domain-containing protein [Candidatus Oleimicrobiaceae bacterium]